MLKPVVCTCRRMYSCRLTRRTRPFLVSLVMAVAKTGTTGDNSGISTSLAVIDISNFFPEFSQQLFAISRLCCLDQFGLLAAFSSFGCCFLLARNVRKTPPRQILISDCGSASSEVLFHFFTVHHVSIHGASTLTLFHLAAIARLCNGRRAPRYNNLMRGSVIK